MFICRTEEFLEAAFDAVVTSCSGMNANMSLEETIKSTHKPVITDARRGFQKDRGLQWRTSVVAGGSGSDHGMDIIVRMAVPIPTTNTNATATATATATTADAETKSEGGGGWFVCQLHFALRNVVVSRKDSGAEKFLNVFRSASELLLRLDHKPIDPVTGKIIGGNNISLNANRGKGDQEDAIEDEKGWNATHLPKAMGLPDNVKITVQAWSDVELEGRYTCTSARAPVIHSYQA